MLADRAHRIARRTQGAVVRAEEGLAQRRGRLHTSARRALGERPPRWLDGRRHRPPRAAAAARRREPPPRVASHARVRALDPVNVLARGWTITRDAGGAVVRSPLDVAPGDVLITQLAAGSVPSTVASHERHPGARPTP